MTTMNLSIKDLIMKDRVAIVRDERFIAIAGILMMGTWKLDTCIPTAATNGRDEIYNPDFMASLSPAGRRFVILHEAYHKMYMHLTVWKHLFEENASLANFATDMVINCTLDKTAGKGADNFIEVWEHAILDHAYDGMDTGEVYRKLKQKGRQGSGGQGKPGQGSGQRSASGGQAKDFDKHDTSGKVPGLDELTEEQVKELHTQIDSALRQGAQMAGRVGGKVDRSITDLMEVSVDWREQLQDFVKTYAAGNDMSTWRKPSRRWMARDLYMPSRYSEAAKRITIGVDTSGSIGPDQLRRAMTEIKAACEIVHPEIVDVIYWDYAVAGHEMYEGDAVNAIVDVTKPVGGGGTRVGAMLEYMKEKQIRSDAIVIFTDGYVESDWGGDDWPGPLLWAISTKGIVAPFGKSLYVPVEE
jgi:predicted metal-dependent peptidase